MRRANLFLALVGFLGAAPAVQGREAWQKVYEDPSVHAAVDLGSIQRDSHVATFRERHVPAGGEIDSGSLRRIAEIQYRRRLDCRLKRSALLSKATFSDRDALVGYEASRAENIRWLVPQGPLEEAVYRFVCGGAP